MVGVWDAVALGLRERVKVECVPVGEAEAVGEGLPTGDLETVAVERELLREREALAEGRVREAEGVGDRAAVRLVLKEAEALRVRDEAEMVGLAEGVVVRTVEGLAEAVGDGVSEAEMVQDVVCVP